MRRLEILALGLICGLVISSILNFVVLTEIRELRHCYDGLRQSYVELVGEEVPEPPISKSQAIEIALKYGGWNETTLKGMEVTASLEYVIFRTGPDYAGAEFIYLHQVTGHVSDYSPREICQNGTCTTFRYIWVVAVTEACSGEGPCVASIPSPGCYFIDPETGEVIPPEEGEFPGDIYEDLSYTQRERIVNEVVRRLRAESCSEKIVGFVYTKKGFEVLFEDEADPRVLTIIREVIGDLPLDILENAQWVPDM